VRGIIHEQVHGICVTAACHFVPEDKEGQPQQDSEQTRGSTKREKQMQTVAIVLLFVGLLAMLVAHVWLLIEVARVNIGWLIGGLFAQPVLLVFGLMHRSRAKLPLLLYLGSLGLLIVVAWMGGLFDPPQNVFAPVQPAR
jgi:hypothetical protein